MKMNLCPFSNYLILIISLGMSGKVSHVMLTGPPGIGKTTVVKKVHQLLVRKGVTVKGFFTEELREDGR